MRNGGANREFYRYILRASEDAQRRFLRAVERGIEAYFARNLGKQPRRDQMLKKWRNDLLLYGEVESLSLLDVAVLKIHKSAAGK
jgi:hypothetical protein